MGNLIPQFENVAFAQFDIYEPFVAVDLNDMILEALDLQLGITDYPIIAGEVMDVNDDGFAVGWFVTAGQSQHEKAFFFSPVDGGSIQILELANNEYLNTTYTHHRALGLTNIRSTGSIRNYDNIVIVGYAESIAGFSEEAFAWVYDSANSSWEISRIFDTTTTPKAGQYQSLAYDINDDLMVAGYIKIDLDLNNPPAARERAVIVDLDYNSDDTPDIPTGTYEIYSFISPSNASANARAYGINDSNEMVGVNFDGSSESPMFYDPAHPFPDAPVELPLNTNHTGAALAINNDSNIVGYGIHNNNTFPVVWWYGIGNGDWYYDTSIQYLDVATDINIPGAVVGHYIDTTSDADIFYELMNTNGEGDPDSSGRKLNGLILFPRMYRSTACAWSANAINDNGWIGGSFKPDDAESVFRPMLFIQNDIDNDRIPDFRKIISSYTEPYVNLDENNNWLLDWGENDPNNTTISNQRVGLHAPGLDHDIANNINNVQVARFAMDYAKIGGPASVPDNFGLFDIVGQNDMIDSDCNACEKLTGFFEQWARKEGVAGSGHVVGSDPERELIVMLRNPYTLNTDFDCIPDQGTDYDERIGALRKFAYRFAHCIDYIQFGNESFQGAGEFVLRDPNNPTAKRLFSHFSGLDLEDATYEVHEWIYDQLETARIASALAGRPLRFIGPGVPSAVISTAYTGDPTPSSSCQHTNCLQTSADKSAYVLKEHFMFLNSERMYFDLHLHYKTVEWAIGDGSNLGVIEMTVDDTASAWAGDAPKGVVCLEWGPKADDQHDWWNGNNPNDGFPRPNKLQFVKYEYESSNNPFRNWEAFVGSINTLDLGWELGQFQEDGFMMSAVLTDLHDHGYLLACYGPTVQTENGVFGAATLIATRVSMDAIGQGQAPDNSYIENDLRYTPLRAMYETAAGLYQLSNSFFQPHVVACDSDVTCPDCP